MQTPPPFSQPPARKSRVGLWVGVILGVLGLCCILPIVLIGIFAVPAFKSGASMVGCTLQATMLRDAVVSYANENKGVLPPAKDWQDQIKKQIAASKAKNKGMEEMPFKVADIDSGTCDLEAKTSLTYNADVAGKKLEAVRSNPDAVLLFETPGTGRNKATKYVPQDQSQAPKVMRNAPRGWLVIGIDGDADLVGPNNKRTRVNASGSSFQVESKASSGGADSKADEK